MGDVQVMHSQSTEVKTKTKKVKKTTKQRRESDVQITEIEPTQEELERGYVSFDGFLFVLLLHFQKKNCFSYIFFFSIFYPKS